MKTFLTVKCNLGDGQPQSILAYIYKMWIFAEVFEYIMIFSFDYYKFIIQAHYHVENFVFFYLIMPISFMSRRLVKNTFKKDEALALPMHGGSLTPQPPQRRGRVQNFYRVLWWLCNFSPRFGGLKWNGVLKRKLVSPVQDKELKKMTGLHLNILRLYLSKIFLLSRRRR